MVFVLTLGTLRAEAFSLLGPYQDWMQFTNGFRQPADGPSRGDIGGPMDIQEEYRWNVPVVSYAFDQSFLDYFGTNGVAAVEQAIQMVNDLTVASDILSSAYPPLSKEVNFLAQALGYRDLKSTALSQLLEELGFAEPSRSLFALHHHGNLPSPSGESMWPTGTIPNLIQLRNFDPETLAASHSINDTLFTGIFYKFDDGTATISPYSPDPGAVYYSAVADDLRYAGEFYTALTSDDVGGLRYLLRSNNVNFEFLVPGVHGVGTNQGNYVDGALRPGIEKLTFVRQDYDALLGQAFPITNQFTDTFITNGAVKHQLLERIITQPDFLFSAADTSVSDAHAPWVVRTGTTNWQNNADLNGNPNGGGPGTICPPIKITFHKLGPEVITTDDYPPYINISPNAWASFDATTNLPVAYPALNASALNDLKIHLQLKRYGDWTSDPLVLDLVCPLGSSVSLETSDDLSTWTSVAIVSNQGSVIIWKHYYKLPQQYFRAVAQ